MGPLKSVCLCVYIHIYRLFFSFFFYCVPKNLIYLISAFTADKSLLMLEKQDMHRRDWVSNLEKEISGV